MWRFHMKIITKVNWIKPGFRIASNCVHTHNKKKKSSFLSTTILAYLLPFHANLEIGVIKSLPHINKYIITTSDALLRHRYWKILIKKNATMSSSSHANCAKQSSLLFHGWHLINLLLGRVPSVKIIFAQSLINKVQVKHVYTHEIT